MRSSGKKTYSYHEEYEYSNNTKQLSKISYIFEATAATYMPSDITVSYSHDAFKRLVGKNIALTGYGSFTSTVGIEYKDNLNQYGTQISKC